ncbi:hypothetical protein BDV98DRAFT_570855 [Pterulicium gracile]|uniref:Uncharacterized protein n=1 Tax=Pterulicium gracile TaxID=1884261 RepID=A0A5C3QE25_9AGAR|nr:hypothetical protein BDV98DRAFT_570855 [Pterula gracilis]
MGKQVVNRSRQGAQSWFVRSIDGVSREERNSRRVSASKRMKCRSNLSSRGQTTSFPSWIRSRSNTLSRGGRPRMYSKDIRRSTSEDCSGKSAQKVPNDLKGVMLNLLVYRWVSVVFQGVLATMVVKAFEVAKPSAMSPRKLRRYKAGVDILVRRFDVAADCSRVYSRSLDITIGWLQRSSSPADDQPPPSHSGLGLSASVRVRCSTTRQGKSKRLATLPVIASVLSFGASTNVRYLVLTGHDASLCHMPGLREQRRDVNLGNT